MEGLRILLPVLGVRDFLNAQLEQLFSGVAGDLAHLLIHAQPMAGVWIGLRHPDGGQLEHGAKLLFALVQRRFGCTPLTPRGRIPQAPFNRGHQAGQAVF